MLALNMPAGSNPALARAIGVRVTAAEATELRERAQAARLSMGAYLRRRALGQRVRIAAELRLGEGRREHRRNQVFPGAPGGRLSPARLRLARKLSGHLLAL